MNPTVRGRGPLILGRRTHGRVSFAWMLCLAAGVPNIAVAGDRIAIFDLGLASSEEMAKLTATGQFLGTPAFAAPEQVERDARDEYLC